MPWCLLLATLLPAAAAAAAERLPEVPARAETEPMTARMGDRADDVAIWRNPADPARSLIVVTDKEAGIGVHDLTGKMLSFQPLGRVNNVDLRADVDIAGSRGVLVAASDRSNTSKPRLRLFRLDPVAGALIPIGVVTPEKGQAYGLCLHRRGNEIDAFMVYKQGVIEQIALDLSGPEVKGTSLRRFDVGKRSEGCVADDRTGTLYVAEDKVAIWRVDTDPAHPMQPVQVAPVDGIHLHKDAEGLALLPQGRDGGLLFASSQYNDSFSVFRLPDATFVGEFRIAGGPVDGTEQTDGIDLVAGDFGAAWPGGLFVAQDGKNRDRDGQGRESAAPQNFKLVPLGPIVEAIGVALSSLGANEPPR
jgi:3-phytase